MQRIGLLLLLAAAVGCQKTPVGSVAHSLIAPAHPRPLVGDGALWTPLTAPNIGTTTIGSIVYDPGVNQLVFLSFDGTPQMWTSTDVANWTQIPTGTPWPGATNPGPLVYNSKNGYVYAFSSSSPGMDTYYWDHSHWNALNVYGTEPTARPNWGATYDPAADRLLFFGGGVQLEGSAVNDFHALDGNPGDPVNQIAWTTLTPTTPGPAGTGYWMSWDATAGFGRLLGDDNQLYTFDTTTFTKTSTMATPSNGIEQSISCAAWDPGLGSWVAFGVPDGNGNGNNVYEHDDAHDMWNLISGGGFNSDGTPKSGLPPGFNSCHLVWYPPLDGLLLIGMTSASTSTWGAWIYKEGWTASGPPTGGGGSGGGGGGTGGTGGTGGGGGGGGPTPIVAPALDLSQTFNHTGVVGQPWVPGFSGSQSSLPLKAGTAPFTVAVDAGDEPFLVDPNTLTITWVPATAGTKNLHVTVTNSAGSASITLAVNVIATTLPAPAAMLTASPSFGPAPLSETVTFAVTPGSGAMPVKTLVDFGDGATPSYLPTTTHVYSRVAGYQIAGTFWQNDGQQATSKSALAVTTPDGIVPPTVAATATPMGGMSVSFAAAAQPGTNPVTYYSWDFGDGASAPGQNAQHTFGAPGSYSVVVVATDSQTFWGSDKVLVVLNSDGSIEPTVRASADPVTGDGPLLVTLKADMANVGASVSSIKWDFGDGSMPAVGPTLSSVVHTYDSGAYTAHVTVQTEAGAEATDAITVMITDHGGLPPQIITVGGATATVGKAYTYDADQTIHARAEGPVSYSTGPGTPSGLRIDPQSGLVTWTPSKNDVGVQRLSFLATSAGGVGMQAFDVTVDKGSGGGGCALAPGSAATGAWPLVVLVGLALAVARRRRVSR